ncbi:MAG: hypothetical protein H6739_11180 [Alphaproteobacteria bacterium]|nr:hypothetical protein [Alphaproteobacteria bacterium]
MNTETRLIGLSLGADICWPAAYEALLQRLDPVVEHAGREVRFACERVTVEPFDLRYTPRYDLVLDRLTHWHPTSREWIKKITLMNRVYALNNPWSVQSMEKHTSYCAMMRLGMPIPDTWMIPPKDYEDSGDMAVTAQRYNRLFDLAKVGERVGYPAFLKPYDGGGWVGVRQVKSAEQLHEAYDASGKRVHHLQAAVRDWDVFVRGIGIGPQVNVIRYDPDAPLHGRYVVDFHYLDGPQWQKATRITRTINAFFGWDFNSCEMLRSAGELHPIDYANPCPDSQVTSLHYHFPWLVKALLRWSLFCAGTRRPMRLNLDWQRFFDVADVPDLSYEERLERYDALARDHFDADRFDEFNARWLSELDAVALEFFGSDRFRDIVHEKVVALYPAHEVQKFTDHFFGLVRFWCKTEADRLGGGA